MNDNEGAASQQIALLESLVEKMREDLKRVQEEFKGRPLEPQLRVQLVCN